MVHGGIKVPVWPHRLWLSLCPCCPPPSRLYCILKVISYTFSPGKSTSVACGCWVCYLSGMGVCKSGSFPQSRTEANRKAHKHTGPLQRSAPQLLGPATHLPLLRPQVRLTSPHTWEELQPACLKKYPP